MANPKLILKNQFGEESINAVIGGNFDGVPVAANTILSNLTGASAVPVGNTKQAVANALPAKAGVTAISALSSPVAPITIALSTGNTYSDAAVNTAVNTALAAAVADLQAQLAQMNLILAQLKVVS